MSSLCLVANTIEGNIHHTGMDIAILAGTITNILQCSSSSRAFPATGLSPKDIQDFHNLLEAIRLKVQEANNNNNSLGPTVLPWLRKVKDVVNDLNDLMEDLRHNKDSAITTTRSLFRATQNRSHRLKVTHQMKKAVEELELLAAEKLSFAQEAMKNERKLTDITKEFENTIEAVGRENSKKEIIDRLMNGDPSDVSVHVFTIVGVAGIGKTKLARLVYEDEEVKAYFKLPRWVDGAFDDKLEESIQNLKESIVEGVAEEDNKGKRFLLVVDNLRTEKHEECLEKLKQLTQVQASGAVLITTRFNLVANKVSGRVKPYALQGLNEEESWCLFKQIRASSNMNEEVERAIVKKYCGGVPVKTITVARLLNCHEESPVSEAELKDEFLQEMRFSYYDQLSMHQKLCFVYCSLFPEDYEIEAERLIHLWMAEGFLSSDPHGDGEFGLACFYDFVPFVFEERDEFGGVMKRYKMNRLMHELARIVAWDENIMVDSQGIIVNSQGKMTVHERVVRASFDFALDVQSGIPKALFEKAKKLRTILLLGKTNKSRLPHEVKMNTSTCDEIFNTFKCLRVLDLHDLGIKMVPSSIGEVKQLRYLDLSHNNIEKLPSSITKLVHLQTLKLSQCHVLKELPKIPSCLMHLYLEGCLDLTYMPLGIGKMSSLQTLSLFVASKNYIMGGLRELTDLNNLREHLEIRRLEQLKLSTKLHAKDKYLREKKHLHGLTLRWDHDEEGKDADVDHNDKDEKTLECLEPNQNLSVLSVVGYHGSMFPNWLSSIQCLVRFSLNDCPKCQFLPSLDHLQHLRVLELRRLDSLEFISRNIDHTSADTEDNSSFSTSKRTPFFPSLKELTISDCPKLRSWWENEKGENDRPFFTSISKLDIQCCPKLHCMPLYPYLNEELILVDSNVRPIRDTMHAKTSLDFLPFSKLKSMQIARITQSPPERWLKNFTSLENLQIRDCSKLVSLPQGFRCLSSLQRLSIEKCQGLDLEKSKTEWEGLKHLRSLTIREISMLNSLPWGVENVKSLQEIGLYECPALTSLPESIGNLTSLGKLVISECRNLDSLPKGLQELKNLKSLIIMDCPLLLPRCQRETGDDWPQIAHIKNIVVKQSSQDSRDLWTQGRPGLGNF